MFAIAVLLTAGAGAGYAQTGLDGSGSAGTQQYGDKKPAPRPAAQDVLGEVGTVEEGQPTPAGGAAPVQETARQPQQAQPTAAPQVAATPDDDGELPFTGFAVVTTLLLGLALVSAGLVLRRTTRQGTQA
jgi:hypothetical protein